MNIQENVTKPSFIKSLSPGENWKSKSMRIIPEEFVRDTKGAFEHRVVFEVRWGNSWQMWLEREKNGLFMFDEDWDDFVDDNFLGLNDVLLFTHQETMFLHVRIIKKAEKEIMSVPLEAEPETEMFNSKPLNSHASASASGGSGSLAKHVKYLRDPKNAYIVKTLTKKNDVLYVARSLLQRNGLKLGRPNSAITYFLDERKEEAFVKYYSGKLAVSGWAGFCRRHNLTLGDTVVCELESSEGLVTAIRVHLANEDV